MNIELEKKYRLTKGRFEKIGRELEALGAVYEGEDFEENTIYASVLLEEKAGVVRIRKTQHRSFLTFKRRLADMSDVKHQVEYETEISDADNAARILAEIGLQPKLVYEKRRKTWRLKDVEVVLDELPFGLFMEIEGRVTGIKEAEMLLGIEDLDTEHETYPRLTARLGSQAGEIIEARF